jgi:hypothetical protein
MPRKPDFSRFLRDARIKRGLSVVDSRRAGRRQFQQHLLLGDRSLPPTGCQPDRIVQNIEVADPGDEGDGCCWVSHTRLKHGRG